MKRVLLFFFLIIVSIVSIHAADREKYDWVADRKRYEVSPEDAKNPAAILKDKRIVEYVFDESRNLQIVKTVHKIVLVNSDEAVEQYNKVYIQVEDQNSLLDIKARSISKTGKVTSFDKNNLKEIKSGEQLAFFKIFAIEGLEVGSEVEYIYTIRKSANFFGREMLQTGYPARDVSVDIISPENMVFEAKGYNGLAEFKDTTYNNKRFLVLNIAYIAPAVEEEYAVVEANLKRVDYKVAYNKMAGAERLLTWEDAAKHVYGQVGTFTSAEVAAVKKVCKAQKFAKLPSEEEKIKAIENYIKSNFILRRGGGEEYYQVDAILKNKFGEELGLVRLFESILNEMKIDHRIVYTSDRSTSKFDGAFDSWNYLENQMIYFPSVSKYIAPTVMELRYGMVPFYWTHNNGLFIRKESVGKEEKIKGEINFIAALPSDKSMDNIYADVVISEDLDNCNIHVKRKIGGYNAIMFQPYYSRITEEQKEGLNDNLLDFISKDADIKNVKVDNIDPNKSLADFPFIIEADLTVGSLLEKAGNKYIFKVGDIIGRQSELYSKNERVNDVENDFNRIYLREIKIKIPQGYVVKNLNDIRINVTHEDKGEKTMGFISDYKQEGDTISISINEYYNRIDFPLAMYEQFRKVINAAADFNKVTLILEKSN